jgi:hypothetical protein
LLAAGENPANPYYFLLAPDGDAYRLYGEGKANETLTEPVADFIRQLSEDEILLLLEATKDVAHDAS